MKILVIQQRMIGDVLTTSILFNELRTVFPNAQLDYLINEHTLAVVEHHPHINNFVVFKKTHEQSKRELLQLAQQIKKEHYDVIIDVYSKISSNIISYISKATTKISYYKYYSTFIYTHNIKRHLKAKTNAGLAIENRLQLLEPLGIHKYSAKPKIYLTDVEINTTKKVLQDYNIDLNKPLIMISVLGSDSSKTYPFKYMANVVDTIVEQTKAQILFNYIPNQKSDAKAIFNLCKLTTQKHIRFDVFGKNLREFLTITKHCNALIGNEGGAVNMAKAIDVKTFTIFSPWIDKDTWSIFEDGSHHISVHLKDYKPELYINTSEKQRKDKAIELYESFKPEFFQSQLNKFLSQLKS